MRRPFVSSSWSQPGDGVRCLSTTKVRLSSQTHAGNLCPPSNRTPSCTHSTCHATHQCHGCIVCRLPTTIPHSPPRYLAGKHTGPAPMGADGSEDWDYPAEPCSRRAPRVQNPLALFGNRIGPGFPRPLSRHTKQTIPTYRTRGPRRAAAPTPLPGRKQLVCSSIPSKSRYAPAELIRKRVPQRTGNGRARDGD